MIYKSIIFFLKYNLKFKFYNQLKILSNNINLIFKNSNQEIKKILLNKKIRTRDKKITFIDALCYIFNYSFIDSTKQSVVSNYNFDNNISVNRSNFYKKELKIPVSFYNDIFIKIKQLTDKYLNKNQNPFNVIAVDGTYTNTNIYNNKKLETCLNMGYYDATNHIPIELEIKGTEFKNKEIESFLNYINKNDLKIENLILVFDRAYFSYDFIKSLENYNLKYVIRVKNNCLCINDKKQIKEKLNNEKTRFITYTDTITYYKKDNDNKDTKLEETIKCYLATNLSDENYSDDLIKKIYCMRWDVEVFFKLVKSNFNFARLREHNFNTMEQYKKKYLIILINLYLVRLIECVYDKYNINKKKTKVKNKYNYNIKHNNTLMITGLKKIINPIIKSELEMDDLISYCDCFIVKTNTIKDISNPRISKTPFTKWYIMSYSDYYKYKKIIESIKNNDLSSLNKNLKLLASNIKII